jgi:uncharacterized NAD-dependent epimerase/dehydratase family protein
MCGSTNREVDEPSKAIVDELIAKDIATDERPQGGAVIVKIDEKLGLTKEKYRTNVILAARRHDVVFNQRPRAGKS